MGRKNLTYPTRAKLAQVREAAHLSQQELATYAKLSLSTYQKIEYGSDPHLSSMVAICDVLEREGRKHGKRRKSSEIFMEVFYERPSVSTAPPRDTPPVEPGSL